MQYIHDPYTVVVFSAMSVNRVTQSMSWLVCSTHVRQWIYVVKCRIKFDCFKSPKNHIMRGPGVQILEKHIRKMNVPSERISTHFSVLEVTFVVT